MPEFMWYVIAGLGTVVALAFLTTLVVIGCIFFNVMSDWWTDRG